MMAAITAVIYTLASVARLDSYASYFLPLPTILVALRHGHTAALRAVLVSVLLLLGARVRGSVGPCQSVSWSESTTQHARDGASCCLSLLSRCTPRTTHYNRLHLSSPHQPIPPHHAPLPSQC